MVFRLKYLGGKGNYIYSKTINPEWDKTYKNCIINYEVLKENGTISTGSNLLLSNNSVKYLIITEDKFEASLKSFADFKTRQGYPSRIDRLSNVLLTHPEASAPQDKIRLYILDQYNLSHLDFVLLVGDHDVLPLGSYFWNSFNYRGDYIYSCLNLPTNFYASFGIGRFSAKTTDELNNIIGKTLAYERNPPVNDSWANSSLLITHQDNDFSSCTENISSAYQNEFAFDYLYGALGASNDDINRMINAGQGTVNYRGHGDYNSWAFWTLGDVFYTVEQVESESQVVPLNNGKKTPVIFSIACNTSELTNPVETLAEAFTNSVNGAVAFLGATNATGNIANNVYNLQIYGNLVPWSSTGYRLTQITNDAARVMLEYDEYPMDPKNIYEYYYKEKNAMEYMWLGDPSLDVYTNTITDILGAKVNVVGDNISVTTGEECNICISGGNSGTDFYESNNNIPTTSLIVNTSVRPLFITITKHNRRPYLGIIGTLASDETWSYNMHVLGDVTVPAGKTLIVKPGTILTFNNNSSLVVNGCLNADGATFDFVSANSTYSNGIKLLPGSSATISSSTIKKAYRGIGLNQAYLNINWSEITGCSEHGIYMYDENSVTNRSEIYACNIHDNTGSGIVLYYSSPIIQVNNIYNNYYGMGLADYSSPSLGYMGAYGCNHIYSNRAHGFSAQRNSNPFLGENICIRNGGHNKIENNTYKNVSVYGNSIVTAENNWWEYLSDNVTINTAKLYVSSGILDYYPPADPEDPARYFDQDPNIVPSLPLGQSSPEERLFDKKFGASTGSISKVGINESQIASVSKDSLNAKAEVKTPKVYDDNWPVLKKLTYAKYLLLLNRDAESSQICRKIVESIPDSSLSYYALDLLWQNGRKNRMEDFKDYLKLLKSSLDKKPAGFMAEVLEARFDKDNRIKLLDELWVKVKSSGHKELSTKAKKDIQESILFSKLLHYMNDEKNVGKAKETVAEIDDLVAFGSHSSVEAHSLVGDIVPEEDILVKEMKESEESAAIEKPTEYSLSGNYPNPFNPSTRIDYTLPMTSKIELKVYDILGHEVATLVNTIQEAGRYSAMFNASNVSSGLYIYKISAHSLETGRVFEKTAKMMYLK